MNAYSKWLNDGQGVIEQTKLESFIGKTPLELPRKNKDRDKSLFL